MADVAHTSDGLPRPNGGPAAPPRNFKKRWAQAVLAYDNMGRPVEDRKAAGHVAMAFKLYMEMDAHGRGAAISDEEFARACGVTSRTAQEFKKWLLASGFVIIRVRGSRRGSTEFEAMIPGETKPEDTSGYSDAAGSPKPETSSVVQVAIERSQPETSSGVSSASADFQKNNPEIHAAKTSGNPHQLPEVVSGGLELPEPITGNSQPSRAHTHATKESPSEILDTKQITTTTTATVEQEASVGSGPLAAMNGHGVELLGLLRQSVKTLHTDEDAIAVLEGDVKAYGADLMLEALVLTRNKALSEGELKNGYRYLIRTAGELRAKRKVEADAPRAPPQAAQVRSTQRDNAMAALERAAAKAGTKGHRT